MGITATPNIGTTVDIIEEHSHAYERWFGATGGVGPGSQSSLTAFRVTSNAVANTFGASIVVLDGTETPVDTGKLSFDPHRIQILGVQNDSKTYRLRLANNSNGAATYAAAVLAGDYTEVCLILTNAVNPPPTNILSKRVPAGTIIWAAIATKDAVAQWFDFIIGIHEYDDTV
jgi:hypothetical protein